MTRTVEPSAATEAVSAAGAARFAAALERLLPEGGRIGLAVSGGPDSLAMLLLAHAALPGRFEVATVDHGLRKESAAEAEFVQGLCDAFGALHATLRVKVAEGNLQDEARNGPVATWRLQGAMPLKYTGPTLVGKGGGDVAMEELVLSCEGYLVE